MDTRTALREKFLRRLCDDLLQIDSEWSVHNGDSIVWWPHDVAQTISTRSVTGNFGRDEGILVSIETEALRDVPLDDPEMPLWLNDLNMANTLSVIALGDDGVLRLRVALRVFDDTIHFAVRWAGWLAACQAADALELAHQADMLGGGSRRARSSHPVSGRRTTPDDILGVREMLVQRSADQGALLTEDALRRGLAELQAVRPNVQILETDSAFFVNHEWVVPQPEPRWADRGELQTMVFLGSDGSYGPSVIVVTIPPYAVPPDLATTVAMATNDLPRHWGTATCLGTWCGSPGDLGVSLRTILPVGMCDGDQDLVTTVANLVLYHSQQATELAMAIEAISPNLEGPDPFVGQTVFVS